MVFHGNKWGWRAIAARMLLTPMLAAGVAASASAQSSATRPAPVKPPAVMPTKSRSLDPKELLKQGRDALKRGDFTTAQGLARQADKANPSGRWGLFGDTPESLEKDIRAARAKADKAEAAKLTQAAKELFARASKARTPADKMAALDKAYVMADRAVALQGNTDFFDGIFGDRPDKLKKEIDAARLQLRRTTPPEQLAQAKPSAAPRFKPTTAAPRFKPTTQQASATSRTGTPSKVVQAGMTAPASPATKAAAAKLLAEGRALLKQHKYADARAKAAQAQKLNVTYARTDDTPDALLRAVLADGQKRIDAQTREADERVARKDYKGATVALTLAQRTSRDLGLPTRSIDSQLAAIREKLDAGSVAVAKAEDTEKPKPIEVPKSPDTPKAIDVPKAVSGAAVAVEVPKEEPAAPKAPAKAKPADSVAVVPVPVPASPLVVPTISGAQDPNTKAPTAPPVALVVPPKAEPKAETSAGTKLIEQAENELRRGDLTTASKLAYEAHNGGYGDSVKEDAQAVLRKIDAVRISRDKQQTAKSFTAAAEYFNDKQYDQALGILRLIDTSLLTPEQKAQLESMMKTGSAALAKMAAPANAVAKAGADVPAKPAPGSKLTDQVRAMAAAEFTKLRAEGLETETKAKDAFGRGDTDVAIQMLSDFEAKVKASHLTAGQQNLLLPSIERRLQTFQIMKRQTDFLVGEARTKQEVRDRTVGKALAETQKREEIGKKVREVNELVKAHKYREAEGLALQIKSLDPDDPTLTAMYEMAKRQRRVADYRAIKDSKEVFYNESLNKAEKPGPLADMDNPIVHDPVRSAIARMRGDGSGLYQKTRSATEREIELKLERPLSVEFENAPLSEVIDEISKKSDLNISLDTASIADEKIALDQVTVTDRLKNLSVRNILSIVLDKARLQFVVEDNVVRVTTEKRAKGRLYTKVFSVMDLVTPIPDFALPDHQNLNKQLAKVGAPPWSLLQGAQGLTPPGNGLQGGTMVGGAASWAGPQSGAPSGRGTLQNTPLNDSAALAQTPRANMSAQLMKLITGMVRPYSWQETGGAGKIDYYDIGGALVVNQTADVIREVQDLLESLRRLQETSVAVEIRVISLSEEFFERVGVDFSVNISTLNKNRLQFERALTTGSFRPQPFINSIDGVPNGVTVGYNPAGGGFTPDLNVPVRATSFPLSLPPFGGYQVNGLNPNLDGGLGVGLAFLNDIQVYMFLEAAQGDQRVSIMQAPKVTLFNGQTSTVFVSDVAFFTIGLQAFNVGGQFVYIPQNIPLPIGRSPAPPGSGGGSGVSVTVQAIVSADKRFVRLNLAPTLTALTSATVPLFPVTAFITPVFEGGSQGVPIPFTQFYQQPAISQITVQTTVAVPDGGTAVLGGLKTLAEGRNEFGPPVLSKIPYLNRLFRNQGIGRETRHIMIMVTPRIIIQSEEELNQTGPGGALLPPPAGMGQ